MVEVEKMDDLICVKTMHARMFIPLASSVVFKISHFSSVTILLLCSSRMADHQRRRSGPPQQQQQPQQPQPPPPQKSTLVPVSLGPLSVQILNYEASLLQQQVCAIISWVGLF